MTLQLVHRQPAQRSCTIRCETRNSAICIVAPHGGGIEPGTTEIAEAIAGTEFSFYSREGRRNRGNKALHVKSSNFSERRGLDLARAHATIISVHGLGDKHHAYDIYVGGLDEDLKTRLIETLTAARFSAINDTTKKHPGRDVRNICNHGSSGKGVQLEITKRLRERMFNDVNRRKDRQCTKPVFAEFVRAIRKVLVNYRQR